MPGKSRTKNCGFTLVELLVVVIIIAIIAAIAIAKFTNASLRGKESALRGELKTLRNGIQMFYNDAGGYPVNLSDLTGSSAPVNCYNPLNSSLVSISGSVWRGPYVSTVDNDPISNTAFSYTYLTGTLQASSADPERSTEGSNYQNW